MRRITEVNRALRAAGHRVLLHRAPQGYYYFHGEDVAGGVSDGVYVYRAEQLSVDTWLTEARARLTRERP
jgi:hypothetical protein